MISSKRGFRIWCAASAFVLGLFSLSQGAGERFDVLIKNEKIVDGTGQAAFQGNIQSEPSIRRP